MPFDHYRRFRLARQEAHQWRGLREVDPGPGGSLVVGGRTLRNFSSNDYLGLASHPALIERSREWTARWGAGSGSSRLVSGNLSAFAGIEAKIAAGKGSEAALIFASGFQLNASLLPALLDREVLGGEPLVFSDRLNHASIHHGCRAAGVRQIRYRHGDLDHLESLLVRYRSRPGPRFILSETVFSMDGDQVDVAGLIELKGRFGAFLYLDEAHATGVFGPRGWGLAAGRDPGADLVMGTFSKALGSFGAYAACSRELREYFINRAGGLVYATALPPSVLGAIDAAVELVPTLDERRRELLRGAAELRGFFRGLGLDTGASSTQIVPVLVGEAEAALALSRGLEERGILAVAIRPPTVPPGGARIRFSLTAHHTPEDLAEVARVVGEVWGGVTQ
ncbi:MAG: 8-amino-7-oxononanoate synthase [Magnetococcales bacterium]|nr:8-amino-7-oxononanoate synthase [Magnetococcales bacterium]